MAEEAAEEEVKKSNKMVKILLIVVVVLGGGAAWFFLMAEDGAPVGQAAVEQEPVKKEAIYVKIRALSGKPYFITNFTVEKFGPQRFLQVYVEARTRDESVKEAMQKHMPLIVHNLTTLFSSQTLADIQTAEGKERLRTESTDKIKEIMQAEIGKPGIEEVFFTNFVMQ